MSLEIPIASGFAAAQGETDRFTARRSEATTARAGATACEILPLSEVPQQSWRSLAARAAEPNAFYLPDWARAVDAHATGKSHARALLVWDSADRKRLIGIAPAVSAVRALGLPVPILVGWEAYAPLTTPLLDCDHVDLAASGILAAAERAGARALLLPRMTLSGPVAQALMRAAGRYRLASCILAKHERAMLDATRDSQSILRDALGAKKLKELRRQRNRLSDAGDVTFGVASAPADIERALDVFLTLEDSGWKGTRGTALIQDAGDAAFIRAAVTKLSASGLAEIMTLSAGGRPVAAGVVLRQGRRAYFFKIAYDEAAARLSPGVQLTLDVTQQLCADASIDDVDSIAVAGHPMIDHVWRERLEIGDLLLPTRAAALPFHALAAAVFTRHAVRERARRVVHAMRTRRRRAK